MYEGGILLEKKIGEIRGLILVSMLLGTLLLGSFSVVKIGGQAQKARVFTYGQPAIKPPVHWNPFTTGSYFGPEGLVVEPLAFINLANWTWMPWLAESWSLSEDGLTLTVNLRRGVKFSDGTDFTSRDVVCTFYCWYLVKSWLWDYIESVEAVDDYKVVFHLKKPFILTEFYIMRTTIWSDSVFGNFSDKAIEIIKRGAPEEELAPLREALRNYRPPKAIGTGAFEIKEYTESDIWLVKRSTYWRGAENVYVDEFMQVNIGGTAQLAPMLTYAFDFNSPDLPAAVYQEVLMKPLLYVPILRWTHGNILLFNCRVYPLNITEVRQAIAYAINRTELAIAASPHPDLSFPAKYPCGMTADHISLFLGEDWAKNNLNNYDYDPKKTEDLLKKIGCTKGSDGVWVAPDGKTRFEFDLYNPPWADWVLCAENLKAQLARVGIIINPITIDEAKFGEVFRRGEFVMGIEFFFFQIHPWETWNRHFIQLGRIPELPEQVGEGFEYAELPNGTVVNLKDLTVALGSAVDMAEQKEVIKTLAWITNYYLPWITLREKPCTYVYYLGRWQWPPKGDLFYLWHSKDEYYALGWIIASGTLKPVPPEEVIVEKPVEVPVEKPVEVIPTWTYGVVGVAVIAVIAAIVVALRRR